VIWDVFTDWIRGVTFAASLRCEALLALNKKELAKTSSLKTVWLATVLSLIATCCLTFAGGSLPKGVSKDETLQSLLADLMPLLGIGVVISSLGVLSWQLLAAQCRNHVASFVVWLSTWFVTIPMATTCSVHLLMDLQGQMTAVILGLLLSSIVNFYAFYTFSWGESLKETATDHSTTSIFDSLPSLSPLAKVKGDENLRRKVLDVVTANQAGPNSPRRVDNAVVSFCSESKEEMAAKDSSTWASRSTSGGSTSSELSSMMTLSTNSAFTSEASTQVIFSMPEEMVPRKKKGMTRAMKRLQEQQQTQQQRVRSQQQQRARSIYHDQRPPPPLSPLMEESSASGSSANLSAASDTREDNILIGDSTVSSTVTGSDGCNSLLEYRRYSELGNLSRKHLASKHRELTKMLSALKAAMKYDLGRTKMRLLEELHWVMIESPDIFEVEHLDRIIDFLRKDDECRKELWNPIRTYLPEPLQKMGLDRLLEFNYLGAHHLKARMDKFILEIRAESNSIQEAGSDMSSVDDDKVHSACEVPYFTACFAP